MGVVVVIVPVPVALSSSGAIAIYYELPVLRVVSDLHVMSKKQKKASTINSLQWCLTLQ